MNGQKNLTIGEQTELRRIKKRIGRGVVKMLENAWTDGDFPIYFFSQKELDFLFRLDVEYDQEALIKGMKKA